MSRSRVAVASCLACAVAFVPPAKAAFITADFSGTVLESTSSIPTGTQVTGSFGFEVDPVIADINGPTPGSDYWLAGSGPDFISYYDSNFNLDAGHSITLRFSILGTDYGYLGGPWFLPTSLTITNGSDAQQLALSFNDNRTVYTLDIAGPANSMFTSLDVRSFDPQGFSLFGGTGFFGFPSGLEGTTFSVDAVRFNAVSVPEPSTLTLLCLALAALRRRAGPGSRGCQEVPQRQACSSGPAPHNRGAAASPHAMHNPDNPARYRRHRASYFANSRAGSLNALNSSALPDGS